MSKFEIGDKVSVLDEAIDGVVTEVKNNEVIIKTTDDFLMTYDVNELIKINNTSIIDSVIASNSLSIKNIDITPSRKQIELKKKLENTERPMPEFDLHIEKLVKNFRGMSNHEILTLQMETAKRNLDFALKNRIPKLVFIHGIGEGILKSELDFMLNRYGQISFQDANYQKYGSGATEVYIKQNPNR